MKYDIKKKIPFVIFTICLVILIGQIFYGIYNNYYLNTKSEKIIAKASSYSFFNLIMPSYENLEIIEEFENVLPINKFSEEKDIKSKILEIIKEKFKCPV